MTVRLAQLPHEYQTMCNNINRMGAINHDHWVYLLNKYRDEGDANSEIEIKKYSKYLILSEMNLSDVDVTPYFDKIFEYGQMGVARALRTLTPANCKLGENYIVKKIREKFQEFFLKNMGE